VERIPLIENIQDYAALAAKLSDVLEKYPQAHGVSR
jgi:hypothetical protein